MSDKRIQLSDDMVEEVAGGNILFVNTGTERYLWGSHAPDQKYSILSSKKVMIEFIQANYDELGERGCLAAMVQAGIIVPM